MKTLLAFSRILVGLLFIFSGIVKANDPVGLSYKMQEFFDLWKLSGLNAYSLALAVVIIAFEIIAGVALLLGWRMKLFSWLLLILILFFTFLTGYAYASDKFKDCGCFGNCLPITPLSSFLKDLFLCFLILFLFVYRKKIRPFLGGATNAAIIGIVTVVSFGLQWYVLNYLPLVDCLPFKTGNNISQQMQFPPNAVPDSFAIRFIYEKDGQEYEFSPSDLPDDLASYNYKSRTDKLIRKGNAEPPIKGFSLSGESGIDSTDIVLDQPYSLLLFDERFSVPVDRWQDGFGKLVAEASEKNIPVYIVTTQLEVARTELDGTPFAGIPVFKCDFTAIRTAARTNPCVYLLQKGTILGKWSYREMGKATGQVRGISRQAPVLEPDVPTLQADSLQTDTTGIAPDS